VSPLHAVIGLGANLGDRLGALREAATRIASFATVRALSFVYESPPMGPPQPHYLNAAVYVEYKGTPEGLLAQVLTVERRMGRVRAVRWGPRTIDLDILWIEGRVVSREDLSVPHPRLTERAFALAPLHDVVPRALDPRTGESFPAADLATLVRLERL
jgi:2-amino-4-hydroxy-6-hydroxymethyldihydropteridine diphosphokinase